MSARRCPQLPPKNNRWKMRMTLRDVKAVLKRSKWIPDNWQKPQAVDTRRRPNASLSAASFQSPTNPESGFLYALPVEIRLKIYEYVLSDPPVLDADTDKAQYPHGPLESIQNFPINALWRMPGRLTVKPPHHDYYYYAPNRLALLLTSKQVYAEAISLFYTLPTFLVQDVPILFDLTRSLLPQRLACIRNLHLHFLLRWPEITSWWHDPKSTPDNAHLWLKIWDTIADRFTGLRVLGLYIRQLMWDQLKGPKAETERRVLMPVSKLRGLKELRLWYRHELGRDPFGTLRQDNYCLQLKGPECEEPEARKFREWVCDVVKKPKGEFVSFEKDY